MYIEDVFGTKKGTIIEDIRGDFALEPGILYWIDLVNPQT